MATIKARRGVEENLSGITLADGELAITTNSHKLYVGIGGVKYCLGSATSLGDMLQSIYDTTGNGIVDYAEKLSVARTINGVAFDGSTNITIADNTKVSKGCSWNDLAGV